MVMFMGGKKQKCCANKCEASKGFVPQENMIGCPFCLSPYNDYKEEQLASHKINQLLASAAASHNRRYQTMTGIDFYFDPNDESLKAAKRVHGSPRLLELLMRFQCTKCNRGNLGVFFLPGKEPICDSDSYEIEEYDVKTVRPECVECYHHHEDHDVLLEVNCWSGPAARDYFGIPDLDIVMKRGHEQHRHLQPNPLNFSLSPAHLVTWAAQLLTLRNIWPLYKSLIRTQAFDENDMAKEPLDFSVVT